MDVEAQARRAREAAGVFAELSPDKKNALLRTIATLIKKETESILRENARDVQDARATQPLSFISRLSLTKEKIHDMVTMVHAVASLPDPIGTTLRATKLDKNFELYCVRVPLGVIAVIFEARPDAFVQIAALALKSGNAVILKGGSEALRTNRFLASLFHRALRSHALPTDAVILLEKREEVEKLLTLNSLVDLVIPRGSYELVKWVQSHTTIPVLGHDAGICHMYVDKDASIPMAVSLVLDAKTNYPAACNAVEQLLVHRAIAPTLFTSLLPALVQSGVKVKGDDTTCKEGEKVGVKVERARSEDFVHEFSDLILAIRTVSSVEEAIQEINEKGSHHTDAIVTENKKTAHTFLKMVDSACVFWNASTRFSDGYRFGLGAEVGVSNKKIHARGPVGLEGLTTYKWILWGKGHTVSEYMGKNAKPFLHAHMRKQYPWQQ